MKKLNFEIAMSLSFSLIYAMLSVTAMICVACGAKWHIVSIFTCLVMFFVCYLAEYEVDDAEYAISAKDWVESTYSYLSQKSKK